MSWLRRCARAFSGLLGVGAACVLPACAQGMDQVVASTTVTADRPDLLHVEPSIASHPEDALHMTMAAVVTEPSSGEVWVDVFVSRDGGQTWTRVSLRDRIDAAVDPWVDYGPDGTIYVSILDTYPDLGYRLGVEVFRSTDGGRTFDGPTLVPWGRGGSYDHPTLVVDRSRGPHRGTVYVAGDHWGERPTSGPRPNPIGVSRSTDGGSSFTGPVDMAPDDPGTRTAGEALVLRDGTLLIPFVGRSGLRLGRSGDGGVSFAAPTLVTAEYPGLGGPDAAVDTTTFPARDRVLLPALSGDGTRIRVLSSEDAGRTFTELASAVTSPSPDQRLIQPAIAVNGEGAVALSWLTSWSEEGGRQCFHRWAAIAPGGRSLSWDEPVRLTETPSCAVVPGEAIIRRMDVAEGSNSFNELFWMGGHYSGLAAAADGAFLFVWATNTEEAGFQLSFLRMTS